MNPELAENINQIAQQLISAQRVMFITGAGISADSGLPTYRGTGGLYNGQSTEEGFSIEDALSGEMLKANPTVTWKYLTQIETGCRNARPNRAHQIIAELEQRIPHILVYTQNIDGLHRAAGSGNIIEIHGDLHHLSCIRCNNQFEVTDYSGLEALPQCTLCGGLLRPSVVLFGENLPRAALDHLATELNQGFDLIFSIGTSSVFPYIVEPVIWAKHAGIPTVEINPSKTQLSDWVDYHVSLGAAAAMDAIAGAIDS